jgi:hypothetical protein
VQELHLVAIRDRSRIGLGCDLLEGRGQLIHLHLQFLQFKKTLASQEFTFVSVIRLQMPFCFEYFRIAGMGQIAQDTYFKHLVLILLEFNTNYVR